MTGDLLKEQLGNLDFADLREYPKTLERLKQLHLYFTTIVAGPLVTNSRAGVNRRISSTTGDQDTLGLIAPIWIAAVGGMAAAEITVARACELSLWFVALLVRPGCLTHLIVLRFGDAFFEHLRTLTPSLGIFIFSELERRKGGRSL